MPPARCTVALELVRFDQDAAANAPVGVLAVAQRPMPSCEVADALLLGLQIAAIPRNLHADDVVIAQQMDNIMKPLSLNKVAQQPKRT